MAIMPLIKVLHGPRHGFQLHDCDNFLRSHPQDSNLALLGLYHLIATLLVKLSPLDLGIRPDLRVVLAIVIRRRQRRRPIRRLLRHIEALDPGLLVDAPVESRAGGRHRRRRKHGGEEAADGLAQRGQRGADDADVDLERGPRCRVAVVPRHVLGDGDCVEGSQAQDRGQADEGAEAEDGH